MYSKRFATQLALAVIAVATLLGSAWAQNLVQNGSFEQPDIGSLNWRSYFAGSADIPGWRVTRESVDVTARYWSPHYDGKQSLDLNGYRPGGIAQDIYISTSGLYLLQFAMSCNPHYAMDVVHTMQVALGDVYSGSFSFDPRAHPGHSPSSMKWDLHSVTLFIPTPGTYTLSFVSTSFAYPADGPALDAVSLSPVPEPASLAVLGTGLFGLLTLRRRKR